MNIQLMLICCLCSSAWAKKSVPVLLWAPNRVPTDFPMVSALQKVTYPSFQANYLNSFKSDKVLMFLQDELSIEDLTNHGEQLKSLANWMETTQSMYLPSVENPGFMAHDLPANGYEMETLEPGSAQAGIDLHNNTKTFILVKLPPTTTNPSRKNALQKANEIIDSVISKIGGLSDFVVVYTGLKSSVIIHDYPPTTKKHVRVRRAASMDLQGYHQSDCVLLYLKKNFILNKTMDGVTTTLIIPEGNHEDVGDCANKDNVMLKILYKEVQAIDKLHITLNFVRNGRRWKMTGVEIYEMNQGVNTMAMLYPTKKMAPVPIGKSYTCGSKMNLRTAPSESVQYSMLIPGMQVEAFTRGVRRFSASWDCVPFFTIPIWAGLITVGLLGPILMLGFYMLLKLKTTDRFDDPKTGHVLVTATVD